MIGSAFAADAWSLTPSSVLDGGLALCDRVLAEHLDAAFRRFGRAGLGLIDLPALGPESLVPAQIGVAAALYWCRELEAAGVLPLVEALAADLQRGSGGWTITTAASRFRPFWRRSAHRFTADERRAIFEQVLAREAFDRPFAALVDGLAAIGRAGPHDNRAPMQIRAATAALEIGHALSERAVGIAGFAARDIVGQVRTALQILEDPEVAGALGGGPPARIVTRHARRLLGREVDLFRHAARAVHGAAILRWIAQGAHDLQTAARSLDPTHPIVAAAEAWRAVSEEIG